MLDDAFNHAVFSCGISAFQDNQDLIVTLNEMTLQLDQLDLQLMKVILVLLFSNRNRVITCVLIVSIFAHDYFLTQIRYRKL